MQPQTTFGLVGGPCQVTAERFFAVHDGTLVETRLWKTLFRGQLQEREQKCPLRFTARAGCYSACRKKFLSASILAVTRVVSVISRT